jgi:hypothetical protein
MHEKRRLRTHAQALKAATPGLSPMLTTTRVGVALALYHQACAADRQKRQL